MDVLLCENHSAPVISLSVLVNVGSAVETNAEAGLCHVIEHMIFKGTPTRPVSAVAREIEAAGGDINAYTSFDQTVFYVNMASRFSDKGLEILSDAVINPLFDEQELERELEVICEEIRRGKDNPGHVVSENLFRHAFSKHTYGRPIIGFENVVKSFDRSTVLSFYKRHYTPKNMTFIVVGDFETKSMLSKISKAFESFKQPENIAPTVVVPAEPHQTNLKIHTSSMDIQATNFIMGFHVPEITHADIAALDVLSHILGGADSSRFEQIVKEKKRLVNTIYCYAFTPKYPGLFMIGGLTQPEKLVEAVDSIWEEIQKIATETVSADELNLAKINIRASEVYERETVGGMSAKFAYFTATAGDHEFEKRYFQVLGDLTAEEIRAVAMKYLTPQNCTLEVLSPKEAKVEPTAKALEAAVTRNKITSVVKRSQKSAPKLYRLKNGIKLVVRENHVLPIVAIYAAMHGGLRHETPKNNGISHLIARSITKGTAKRNAVEVAKKIESIAGMIEGVCGRNAIGLRCEFLSEKLYDGFGMFAEVMCAPSFDKKEVEKEKALQIETIKNQEDHLTGLAFAQFMKSLYGKHPYGMRITGTKETVSSLTADDLRKFWKNHLNPADIVITVVGDVNPEEIKKLANDWIDLKKIGRFKAPKAKIVRPKHIVTAEKIKKGKEQAHIVLGFLGTHLGSPDNYKLAVLNHILAGQGGRLFSTLRDKMSLAYAVNSTMHVGPEEGYFAVYIGCDPSKTETAINGIKNELSLISKELVSPEELERAKQYMVGAYELDQQRVSALASGYTYNELYGLGIAELEQYPQKILKVTRQDVLTTAKRYLDLKAYVLSVIKP